MLWNLVAVNYERYHLHHLAKILVLAFYSLLGAWIFIILESENERFSKNQEMITTLRASLAAKNAFVERIHELYFGDNTTQPEFSEVKLRKVMSEYDSAMGIKINGQIPVKWDIWGGLYYSGTIYTTIGYGDLAAVTVGGRIFTMIYAMIGIPMVITILNDWGNMLFYFVDHYWKSHGIPLFRYVGQKLKRLKRKVRNVEEGVNDSQPLVDYSTDFEQSDGTQPVPLLIVAVVLLTWVMLCVGYFTIFENWTFFESVYFFFISMTTIGFGDITPNHSVAVGGIIFILGGLSVVSMFINVIQMKLEFLFNKIIQDIENDFKNTLSVSAEESRKKSIGVSEFGSIEPSKKKTMQADSDVSEKYTQSMDGTNKFLMKFMSNHQKKMLNEKFDERAKMRNSYTQTTSQIKVASVQTADKYEQHWDEDPEEEQQPVSRINTRRLYIYNTGE